MSDKTDCMDAESQATAVAQQADCYAEFGRMAFAHLKECIVEGLFEARLFTRRGRGNARERRGG